MRRSGDAEAYRRLIEKRELTGLHPEEEERLYELQKLLGLKTFQRDSIRSTGTAGNRRPNYFFLGLFIVIGVISALCLSLSNSMTSQDSDMWIAWGEERYRATPCHVTVRPGQRMEVQVFLHETPDASTALDASIDIRGAHAMNPLFPGDYSIAISENGTDSKEVTATTIDGIGTLYLNICPARDASPGIYEGRLTLKWGELSNTKEVPIVVNVSADYYIDAIRESANPTACDIVFYVSHEGDDKWSGRLAESNETDSDGPFASIQRAMSEVRGLRGEGETRSVTVFIREGTYFLDEPLVFTPEDGGIVGEKGTSVVYAAYENEQVVISGGKPIDGWEIVDVGGRNLWVTYLPEVVNGEWRFSQLFVNGERRFRPRLPKSDWFYVRSIDDGFSEHGWEFYGQDSFFFNPGELKSSWTNIDDIEIVAVHFWVESRLPIERIDEDEGLVTLKKYSTYRLSDGFQDRGARYYVENVFEAMDSPGEWYLNQRTGELFYYPYSNETPEMIEVIAPKLTQVIRVEGDPEQGKWVENLHFDGLTFSHTEFSLPDEKGVPGVWNPTGGFIQGAVGVPGAVFFIGSRHCSFRQNNVSNVGTYAVEFGHMSMDNLVEHNNLTNLGAGGIKIGTGTTRTAIVSNEIGHGGKIFHSANGIMILDSGSNIVSKNHVHNFFQSGISVGWVWGYGASRAQNNLIELNHVHDIGCGLLSDLGGIYTLGARAGTVIRFNRVHDINAHESGAWGIYLDEGSSDVLVEKNIVYRTMSPGFLQHYGRNNIVRNNIFAFAEQAQLQLIRVEKHNSFSFERNIVYFSNTPVLWGPWESPQATARFYSNLYFSTSGGRMAFGSHDWISWQRSGMDIDSEIKDPLFVDPLNDDFSLRENSPAFKLGFASFDVPNFCSMDMNQLLSDVYY